MTWVMREVRKGSLRMSCDLVLVMHPTLEYECHDLLMRFAYLTTCCYEDHVILPREQFSLMIEDRTPW